MTTPNTNESDKLVNPPSGGVQMVNPPTERKVKIRMLRDVADPRSKDKVNPNMLAMGSIIEVDVKTAKELLNRKYPGFYEFSGERPTVEKKGVIRVAERYVEPLPAEELEGA